jgi:hypothetical protein
MSNESYFFVKTRSKYYLSGKSNKYLKIKTPNTQEKLKVQNLTPCVRARSS